MPTFTHIIDALKQQELQEYESQWDSSQDTLTRDHRQAAPPVPMRPHSIAQPNALTEQSNVRTKLAVNKQHTGLSSVSTLDESVHIQSWIDQAVYQQGQARTDKPYLPAPSDKPQYQNQSTMKGHSVNGQEYINTGSIHRVEEDEEELYATPKDDMDDDEKALPLVPLEQPNMLVPVTSPTASVEITHSYTANSGADNVDPTEDTLIVTTTRDHDDHIVTVDPTLDMIVETPTSDNDHSKDPDFDQAIAMTVVNTDDNSANANQIVADQIVAKEVSNDGMVEEATDVHVELVNSNATSTLSSTASKEKRRSMFFSWKKKSAKSFKPPPIIARSKARSRLSEGTSTGGSLTSDLSDTKLDNRTSSVGSSSTTHSEAADLLSGFLSSRNLAIETMAAAEKIMLEEIAKEECDVMDEKVTSGIVRRLTSLFEDAANGANSATNSDRLVSRVDEE